MAVVKELVFTISTDMWVPVEDPSFESKSQIRTEVASKQLENANSPIKLTVNRTHARKQTAIK